MDNIMQPALRGTDAVNTATDMVMNGAMNAGAGNGGGAAFATIFGIILIVLGIAIAIAAVVFFIIAWWRIYTKAGRPGWSNLIPVYGWVEFFNVAWGSGLYFLFMLIPGVNVLVAILTVQKLSESYGHGLGFTLGLFFFPYIFILILGFGKSKHIRFENKQAEEAKKQAILDAAYKAATAQQTAVEEVPAEEPVPETETVAE